MDTEKPIELILEEIKSARPQATLEDSGRPGQPDYHITIELPYECVISAHNFEGDLNYFKIAYVNVPEELRGREIALRLIRSMTLLVKTLGARILAGDIESPEGLKVMGKVFGKENLKLSTLEHGTWGESVPVSYDEALNSDSLKKKDTVYVETNLEKVDDSEWEQPVVTFGEHHDIWRKLGLDK